MDFDQQIQTLIDKAPQDGVTPNLIRAIAPALRGLASRLHHSEYFVLQTLEEHWLVTTLSSRQQSNVEKKVVYAFPTPEDAIQTPGADDPQLVALPVPATHILFQMMSLKTVDSTIFFETPGQRATGVEIACRDVQEFIKLYLQRLQAGQQPPPDIA
jgi:hypothetical protein